MIRRNMFSCCIAASVAALISTPEVARAQAKSQAATPTATSSPAAVASELNRLQRDPANWPMQAGNYAGWRYTPLDQINRSNVKDLKIGWQVSTGVLRGHEGGPLVVDGMLYFQTPQPFIIYAIDLDRPGEIKWKYNANSDQNAVPMACCDLVNRGPAYADGKLFMTTLDNHVIALDAKTGNEIWKVQNGNYAAGETITMSPLVVGDKVIVGNAGGEYGVRGTLTAYGIQDGHVIWRAFGAGPDKDVLIDPQTTLMMGKPIGEADLGVKSWHGDQWQHGGASAWGWISYDPDLNLIYYGTSNPGTWNPNQRPGDNKWSTSIFARDPNTGMAKWVFQLTPHDEWDYDAVNENILADLNVGGQQHKALVHLDRNGFGYTIDRETGVLLVAEKYDPAVNWAERIDLSTGAPVRVAKYSTSQGVDNNVKGICPASIGSKDQQPAAYSPRTRLFYVPTNHVCMDYEPIDITYVAGQPYVGAIVSMYGADKGKLGRFIAWDATTGRTVWEIPENWAVWSGALATGGDVVFYGTMDGYAKAIDARSGKELWQQKLPSGIIGNFMSFEHKGKQYVAVLSGIGGWAALGLAAGLTDPNAGLGTVGAFSDLAKYTNLGGTLTVFEVSGDSTTGKAAVPQQRRNENGR
jgi:lanthanide-dependent methanol dehydrogenase